MIERKLHAAIVDRMAQLINDIQRYVPTFTNQRFLRSNRVRKFDNPILTTVDQVDRRRCG
ncbi:hypothetical protein D3C78_1910940 [compost metagenome]